MWPCETPHPIIMGQGSTLAKIATCHPLPPVTHCHLSSANGACIRARVRVCAGVCECVRMRMCVNTNEHARVGINDAGQRSYYRGLTMLAAVHIMHAHKRARPHGGWGFVPGVNKYESYTGHNDTGHNCIGHNYIPCLA